MSATLFVLYGIINLIDTNNVIKNFNVLDVSQSTRSTLVYAYTAGHYMFMLKLVIALVTLFVLTLIIRIAVVTVIHIFTPQEQQGGAVNIMIGAASNLSNKVMEAVTSNMKYVLGFMTPSAFIIVYLVIIPIFVLLFMMVFVRTYDQNIIKNENKDNAPRIMETQHHYLMMFLASLVFMSFVFLIIDWMSRSFKSVDK
jgi:hypothetical protein